MGVSSIGTASDIFPFLRSSIISAVEHLAKMNLRSCTTSTAGVRVYPPAYQPRRRECSRRGRCGSRH
eukprot:987801-Pyramimonas_sp.AAC.1